MKKGGRVSGRPFADGSGLVRGQDTIAIRSPAVLRWVPGVISLALEENTDKFGVLAIILHIETSLGNPIAMKLQEYLSVATGTRSRILQKPSIFIAVTDSVWRAGGLTRKDNRQERVRANNLIDQFANVCILVSWVAGRGDYILT